MYVKRVHACTCVIPCIINIYMHMQERRERGREEREGEGGRRGRDGGKGGREGGKGGKEGGEECLPLVVLLL